MGQASGFGGGNKNGEGHGVSQPADKPQQPEDLNPAEPGVSPSVLWEYQLHVSPVRKPEQA